MSETPAGSGLDRLHDALVQFTGCVGEALVDVCSYSLTIGETYVPFDPDEDSDCSPDDAACSQAWVRVTGVQAVYVQDSFEGNEGCSAELSIGLEVGVTRCTEIPTNGEAPSESDVLAYALQSMTDMQAIYCAAMACEVWESITSGQWTPSGPLGGLYGGVWTFTVEL